MARERKALLVAKPDLNKITVKEFRSLFNENQTPEEGDAILAKCCGMTVEEIQALGYQEYRQLVKAFYEAAREPLSNPN
jgi:hypothetical protein